MAKNVGTLIKEARTNAGLTQEQLAKKVAGLSAADISKAERGEKTLTQDQLKAIAKATGVTQKSLLDAAKGTSGSSGSSGSSKSGTSVRLSAAEKKLVELYRKADADTKAAAVKLLEGKQEEADSSLGATLLSSLTGGGDGSALSSLLGSALGSVLGGGGKKET